MAVIPLMEDPDWVDILPYPVAAGEGVAPVVEIGMGEQPYSRAAYMYTCVAAHEVSDRVFRLTAEVIGDNAANYTAWAWRWRCLQGGCGSKEEELFFIAGCALNGAKNYQLWNHRRRVALELGPVDVDHELRFAAECLVRDPKNYHVWAHRQAVLIAAGTATGPWVAEATLTTQLILDDARNNSAWAQRAFILFRRPSALSSATPRDADSDADVAIDMTAEVFTSSGNRGSSREAYRNGLLAAALEELDLVAAAIRSAPSNGSPWAYLNAVLQQYCSRDGSDGSNDMAETIGGNDSSCSGGGSGGEDDRDSGGASDSEAFVSRVRRLCFQVLDVEPNCTHAKQLLSDFSATS